MQKEHLSYHSTMLKLYLIPSSRLKTIRTYFLSLVWTGDL